METPAKRLQNRHTPNAKLRFAREKHGWTREYVAQQIAVSPESVKNWENGDSFPYPASIQKLCELFNLSTDDLGLLRSNQPKESESPTPPQHLINTPPGPTNDLPVEATGKVPAQPLYKNKWLYILLVLLLVLSAVWYLNNGIRSSQPSVGQTSAQSQHFQAQGWTPILQQPVPDCHNPQGVAWYVHRTGTSFSCKNTGLEMQQIAPHPYAEIDLASIHNTSYPQTVFHVQVQVRFQNSGDGSTSAAMLVQTPAPINAVGGYIFVLSPIGRWQLQYVQTQTAVPIVRSGFVSINAHQAVLLSVTVQNNVLQGFINNQQIVSQGDTLNPLPGDVGLLVEGSPTAVPSSLVLFSNFELDSKAATLHQ